MVITERLREISRSECLPGDDEKFLREAADRIDSLARAVRVLLDDRKTFNTACLELREAVEDYERFCECPR